MRTRSKFFWPALTLVTVMFTLSSLAVASLGAVAFAGTSPTISSDKSNYVPGELVTLTGAGWDSGEAVHIFVNDNDGQTWSYSADVTADDQGNFTNSFNLPDWFIATYYVTATGAASGTATTTFTDATVQISNASKPADPTNSTSASFVLNTSPGTQATECQLDGGGFASCTSPKSYSSLAQGSHTFDVRLTADHNKSDSYTWFVDLTNPDTTINTSPSNPTTSTSAAFTFTGSDNHTTQQAKFTFQCSLDGAAYSSCNSPKTYAGPLALGGHTFDVKATDEAGNTDGTPAHYAWTIQSAADTTAPVVTVTIDAADTVAGSGWYNIATSGTNGVLVHVSASDTSGVTNITCIDNGTATLINASTNPNSFILGNGSHSIACTATDGSSNTGAGAGSTAMPIGLMIDQAAPTISAALDISPAGTGWFNISTGAPTVSFTCGDTGTSGLLSCPASHLFGEGASQSWNGTAYDNAGNSASDGVTGVNVDLTAPSVSVTGFTNGHVYTLGDPLPTAGCSSSDTGGSGIASTTGPTQTTFLSVNGVGTATFGCSATDNAGNGANASASYSVHYANVSGILQPINPDNTSVFKRGQAVPVKFMLAGDEFTGFNTSGWTIQKQSLTCGVFDGADATLESVGSNTPSQYFRYDSAADQYIYNADMHNLGVNTCWNFKVTLDSGQVLYSAVFKLTK